MKSSGVIVVLYTIYYSTHTRTNLMYLFYTIKIQMIFWGMKKEKQVC